MINLHIIIMAFAFPIGIYMYFKREIREMELEFQHGKFGPILKSVELLNNLDDDEPKRVKSKNYKSCNGYRRY